MPEKEVVNPGLGMYHHNFSAIELSTLTESGARARGKRGAFADQSRPLSLPNNLAELDASRADAVTMLATTIEPAHCVDLPETGNDIELADCVSSSTSLDVQDGEYDGDDESELEDEHEVIEVGTAKVVFGVKGLYREARSTVRDIFGQPTTRLIGRVLVERSTVEESKDDEMDAAALGWWHTRG